jgi:hypothetical protein
VRGYTRLLLRLNRPGGLVLGSDSDEDKDAPVAATPESGSVTGRRRLTGRAHLPVAASTRATWAGRGNGAGQAGKEGARVSWGVGSGRWARPKRI